MKKIFIVLIFVSQLITQHAFALTFKAYFRKGATFQAQSLENMGNRKLFPASSYDLMAEVKNPLFKEPPESMPIREVNFENAQDLVPTMKLKLVSYDKSADTYKFNLVVLDELRIDAIGLGYTLKSLRFNAQQVKVRFENGTNVFPVIGKFVRRADHKDDSPYNDFIIAVDELNQITITFKKEVPILVEVT